MDRETVELLQRHGLGHVAHLPGFDDPAVVRRVLGVFVNDALRVEEVERLLARCRASLLESARRVEAAVGERWTPEQIAAAKEAAGPAAPVLVAACPGCGERVTPRETTATGDAGGVPVLLCPACGRKAGPLEWFDAAPAFVICDTCSRVGPRTAGVGDECGALQGFAKAKEACPGHYIRTGVKRPPGCEV